MNITGTTMPVLPESTLTIFILFKFPNLEQQSPMFTPGASSASRHFLEKNKQNRNKRRDLLRSQAGALGS